MTESDFREKLIEALHDHLSWMRELISCLDELSSKLPKGRGTK